MHIAVIICSTRPERVGDQVANWVFAQAKHPEAVFRVVDLKDYHLPNYGEVPNDKEKWDHRLAHFDGFIFVTPEYNHSITGALKNALDITREPLKNKAAAIVSYGSSGGVRAAEHLRQILAELEVADVRTNLTFSRQLDFEADTFKPNAKLEDLNLMLAQLVSWAKALKTIRKGE